ncbi:hypothetical protein CKO15_12760 [Halorhodospira abdelmalekii]|uniref:PAS domain S-box protein n=1 Tax=Halorhodospira abdelmalekii TaxID=421629 RepID=UPI001905D7B6|nr:PAS domain S-box protein [Halorhodospira abdelmalekii]MBK1736125.1 hypothetical protein [Halorhodospira abdelmalekii]
MGDASTGFGQRPADFFRRLLDCQAAAVCALDSTGRLIYLNPAACRRLGHSDESALLGECFDTVLDTERIELSATALIERLIQVAVSGESLTIDSAVWLRPCVGDSFPIVINASPLHDEKSGDWGVALSFQDITEQREALERSKARRHRLEAALRAVPDVALIETDLEGTIREASRSAELMFGYSREALLGNDICILHDPTEHEKVREGIARLQQTGEGYATECELIRCSGERFQARLSIAPLLNERGEVVGKIGSCIDLSAQFAREQRLLMAQEAAGFGVWEWDVETDRAYWDATSWRMLGFAPKQQGALTYAQWQALVHPKDLERILPDFEHHLAAGTPFSIEFRYRCADGGWLWVQNRGQTLRRAADGSPIYMVGTQVEIQRLKETERALAESEQRFRDVTLAAGEYIWEIDPEGRYSFITSPAEALLGRPVEAISGHSPFDFMPDDEAERVRGLLKGWADEKSSWQGLEHASLRPDGSLVHQRVSGLPILDEDGNLTGFRGTGRDITAEKEAERAQKRLTERLRLATSAAELGIWDYDLISGRLECDEGMCRLYGIAPASLDHASEGWPEAPESKSRDTTIFGHTFEDWTQALLSKSRDSMVAALNEAVASRAPFDIQMEIRRADDGRFRTLHGQAQVICDASGAPVRIVGISRDITAEQEYRRHLAAAKERFAGIFEQTGSGVAVYRPVDEGRDFEFIEINPASERIEQITRDEVIGRRLTDCFPGIVEMGLLAALQRVARTGVPEELPLASYQDERITAWRENRIFRLSSGEVVAVYEDRTEIKQAQQESERARKQLANLTAQLPGFIYQYRLWPDGRHAFVYANGRAEQIYGVTPEQAIEYPDHLFEVIYEADRGEFYRSIERSAQALTPWYQTFRIHHSSKGTAWLEGNSMPERLADGSTLWHGYLHDITDRVRSEQELAQSKALLEDFFNQSITGFFFMMLDKPIDWQGASEEEKEALLDYVMTNQRMTKINQALLDQYRTTEEELIGRACCDFFTDESIEHSRAVLREVFDRGQTHAVTHEKRSDGTPMIINGYYTCLYDEQGRITGHFGVQEDITERRRAEEAEKELREQLETRYRELEAIFAAAQSVSLIKTDRDTVIQEVSCGTEALFGYSRSELIGQHVSMLHAQEHVEARQLDQSSLPIRLETKMRRRDGTTFMAHLAVHPILDADDQIITALSVSFDISDQKRAEQELAEAVAAKTTFLNAVSHDLRSPLNALTGFVDLLAAPDLGEEERQSYVRQCHRASGRLLELIDSLLDLSRLQAGRLKLRPAPFDLHAAIQSQCTVYRHLAGEHGLAFTCTCGLEAGVPQWVEADATRLGQILSNLLSNAIKYTQEGGIDLTVIADAGNRITFQVRDTGPGIPPEQQAHIFAAFDRVGYQGSRSGHGLGLAIVRELTELFGGEIALESTPGVGSTFSVTLPLTPVAAPERERDAAPDMETSPLPRSEEAPASPLHVLVADDEPTNVFLAQVLLEQLGCTVTTAKDGASALEAWQTQRLDALVLDRHMPDLDGVELAERIRAEEQAEGGPRVPIALYTAYARSEVETVLEGGLFDAFLGKPLDRTELRQWIESLARRQPPADPNTNPGEPHGSALHS